MTIDTPYGKLRTTTRRRYVLVRERGGDKGGPYADGYTDSISAAIRRARRRITSDPASLVYDTVTKERVVSRMHEEQVARRLT